MCIFLLNYPISPGLPSLTPRELCTTRRGERATADSTVPLENSTFYSLYNTDHVTGYHVVSLSFLYPCDSLMFHPAVQTWWIFCRPGRVLGAAASHGVVARALHSSVTYSLYNNTSGMYFLYSIHIYPRNFPGTVCGQRGGSAA